jgi:hypothetical protein
MGDLKAYLLDTNAFVYPTNPGKENKENRRAATVFWEQARIEIETGDAVLCIPREVARELEVQSYSLGGGVKQHKRILELLDEIEETYPDITTPEIEHQLRKISAFVGESYREGIKQNYGIDKVKYGGVSDARILYTAWQYDCVLVTANIKDFVIYPLLFSPGEDRLFDILSGTYKYISSPLFTTITTDPLFEKMMEELHSLIEDATKEA